MEVGWRVSATAASPHTCRAESSAAQEKLIQPVSQEMGLNQAITDSRSLPLRAGPRRVQREDHRFVRLQRLAGLPPDKTFRSLSSSCHSSASTASKVMQHPRLIVSEN